MHLIEEVFGKGCDLYEQVLKCKRDADKAELRKAYYRAALKFHPDKNPNNPEAAKSFQAVSVAYQILQNPELREEYNDTGVIPHSDAIHEAENNNDGDDPSSGVNAWTSYFNSIFGKVTMSKIDSFAAKYKCSDEERRDVMKEFIKTKGNLVKMLEFVMLSEACDAVRWVDDYLKPALDSGELKSSLRESMESSLKKIHKLVEKEAAEEKKQQQEQDDDDNDNHDEVETETEEDNDKAKSTSKKQKTDSTAANKKMMSKNKGTTTTNKKKSSSSRKNNNNTMDDLIAQIQNKNKRGGNLFAALGARYGINDHDVDKDPLSDADFAKAQARLDKKRKKR